MIRRLVVDEAAAEESESQTRYYAERVGPELAIRFVAEIEAIYRGLAHGRFVGANVSVLFRVPIRRVFLDRFPFAVVFYVEGDLVYVIAVEALRRRPGYWRTRLR